MINRQTANLLVVITALTIWCQQAWAQAKPDRIVSLNGTVTEILCGLGLQTQIVGVDVTSTYPAAMEKVAKVGHNRNIGAEAVLALQPTLIVGTKSATGMDIKPELIRQFQQAGVKTLFFEQTHSVAGAKKLIQDVGAAFRKPGPAAALVRKLDADLARVQKPAKAKKVLFIYARGAGNMMVAGEHTPVDQLITLAGGQNAVSGFDSFKPLTAEALVSANPDVILLFSSGLESLGGMSGLLNVPGVAQTNAGRNKAVIEMDGQLMTGFSPRLGLAVQELSRKLNDSVLTVH
ncbi:heme/hemin ABC transporter substrate-binding protein [Arsenicibacter rosenii]|uniref:Hemin ABC transporter substrate-binding protein n=1 Tax=Arsenicibacter rosenii TaxID=1750698 RepID=A0A1S2VLI3_9BACT|nr:ABC transporter substrate-binding protein [Arsenicibacter rosenii]OIN59621.1 hemin ABC transporter substrate-binding protein [Arsenicibacter rosenii]